MKLYRAVSSFDNQILQLNHYIQNPRKPRDTETELHHIIDDWFFNKFGIRARSQCIFCSPNREYTSKYMQNGGIMLELELPPGEPFNIIFSLMVDDLYADTCYFSAPYNRLEIHQFLEGRNYTIVNNLDDVPSTFRGELMLSINKFLAKVA
ncbi:hypothetical protein [Cronobacter dublinensis]|uniref:hypothetical protein n=1 Tax=Cronobacter dublinensis TaxID=413497 RepID=UPI00131A12BA|nr:hypothetical protein [Cronobacter dublinensis]